MSPHTKKINEATLRITKGSLGRFAPRLFVIACIVLTVLATFRIISTSPLSVDSYAHIAVGEYILQTGTIPSHRDLSYKSTEPSLEWISHSWLADILLYMGQSISLPTGILIILIPLLALSGYLAFLLIPRPRDSPFTIMITLATIVIAAGFWRYHPFIFMIPLQLTLMHAVRMLKNGNKTAVYVIPIIFLIWANAAGGYIILPALYCTVTAAVTVLMKRLGHEHNPHYLQALSIALLFGIVFSMLNPYGVRIWMYWLTVLAVVHQNRAFSSLMGALGTYNQTTTHQAYSSFYLTLFVAYSGILSLGILSQIIKSGREKFIRYIAFAPHILIMMLGYFWVRFIPFAVLTLIPLASSFLQTQENEQKTRLSRTLWPVTITAGLLAALLVYVSITVPNTPVPRIPYQLAQALSDLNAPENILTTYDNTGYIMYTNPGYKVMLDAQDDLIDDNSLITNYQPVGNFTSSFQNIRSSQGIRTAVISRDVSGLAQTLATDDDWALIYFDDNGAIFVDRTAMTETNLTSLELKFVNLEKNLGFAPETATQSAAELEAFILRYPQNYFALGQLATIYRITKNYDLAFKRLNSIPKPQWTFATYTELGRLEAAQGRCASAEKALLTALSYRNEKNYSRTVLDIAVLYAGCLGDKTKARHYFQRYNSFLMTTSEREKLNTLTKQFGIDFSN